MAWDPNDESTYANLSIQASEHGGVLQYRDDLRNEGYQDGYDDGYDNGYQNGHNDGYQNGHDDGVVLGVSIGASIIAAVGGIAVGIKRFVDKRKEKKHRSYACVNESEDAVLVTMHDIGVECRGEADYF